MNSTESHDNQAPEDGASTPPLEESLRQIGAAGKDSVSSAVGTVRALRKLFLAEFALARVALARAMVWLCVAAVFGVSTWLLLMGALIALLQHVFGLTWLESLSIAAALSLLIAVIGVFQTLRFFSFTRMDATRRQLKLMGIGDDEDEDEDQERADAPAQPPASAGGSR